jgi:hypothetical protein
VNSRRPRGFWRADMGYFLRGSIEHSSEQSIFTHRSSELRTCLLSLLMCMTLANPFLSNPLANAGLTRHPNFHSCINSKPVSHSETRSGPQALFGVRPALSLSKGRSVPACPVQTGLSADVLPLRSVRQGPSSTPSDRLSPPIHFSYPFHSFFLLWKFLFPFDAAFPLALPLHC